VRFISSLVSSGYYLCGLKKVVCLDLSMTTRSGRLNIDKAADDGSDSLFSWETVSFI